MLPLGLGAAVSAVNSNLAAGFSGLQEFDMLVGFLFTYKVRGGGGWGWGGGEMGGRGGGVVSEEGGKGVGGWGEVGNIKILSHSSLECIARSLVRLSSKSTMRL
jgi:hypothetical protein